VQIAICLNTWDSIRIGEVDLQAPQNEFATSSRLRKVEVFASASQVLRGGIDSYKIEY